MDAEKMYETFASLERKNRAHNILTLVMFIYVTVVTAGEAFSANIFPYALVSIAACCAGIMCGLYIGKDDE